MHLIYNIYIKFYFFKKSISNPLPLKVIYTILQKDQISYDGLGKFIIYNLFIDQFQCRKISIREIKENYSHTTNTEVISAKIILYVYVKKWIF